MTNLHYNGPAPVGNPSARVLNPPRPPHRPAPVRHKTTKDGLGVQLVLLGRPSGSVGLEAFVPSVEPTGFDEGDVMEAPLMTLPSRPDLQPCRLCGGFGTVEIPFPGAGEVDCVKCGGSGLDPHPLDAVETEDEIDVTVIEPIWDRPRFNPEQDVEHTGALTGDPESI